MSRKIAKINTLEFERFGNEAGCNYFVLSTHRRNVSSLLADQHIKRLAR